jgi:hypothetical protein
MLELLHLFADAKTSVKALWEAGVLQGFLESSRVHATIRHHCPRTPASSPCLVAHLSLVIGASVSLTVRTAQGDVLELEVSQG